ncbi:MAG: hydantoinase B/oxoprolinase family protein, partial [Pseudomonadota bacterium]|nr:hydantoinase B/oxoprolinase family protein [Pseudomonadota bacterium]
YGVVISNGAVDEAATEKLRAEKAANKSEAKLFNFGDELEELRSNCLKETGLEPPAAPDFSKSRMAAE